MPGDTEMIINAVAMLSDWVVALDPVDLFALCVAMGGRGGGSYHYRNAGNMRAYVPGRMKEELRSGVSIMVFFLVNSTILKVDCNAMW